MKGAVRALSIAALRPLLPGRVSSGSAPNGAGVLPDDVVPGVDSGLAVLDAAVEVSGLLFGACERMTTRTAVCTGGVENHAVSVAVGDSPFQICPRGRVAVGDRTHCCASAWTLKIEQAHLFALGRGLPVRGMDV